VHRIQYGNVGLDNPQSAFRRRIDHRVSPTSRSRLCTNYCDIRCKDLYLQCLLVHYAHAEYGVRIILQSQVYTVTVLYSYSYSTVQYNPCAIYVLVPYGHCIVRVCTSAPLPHPHGTLRQLICIALYLSNQLHHRAHTVILPHRLSPRRVRRHLAPRPARRDGAVRVQLDHPFGVGVGVGVAVVAVAVVVVVVAVNFVLLTRPDRLDCTNGEDSPTRSAPSENPKPTSTPTPAGAAAAAAAAAPTPGTATGIGARTDTRHPRQPGAQPLNRRRGHDPLSTCPCPCPSFARAIPTLLAGAPGYPPATYTRIPPHRTDPHSPRTITPLQRAREDVAIRSRRILVRIHLPT
jgi:hypothetical protein